MSRLYDRVMADGCRPISARDVWDTVVVGDGEPPDFEYVAEQTLGRPPMEGEAAALRERISRSLEGSFSNDVVARQEIADSVVISAEEVADYVATLPPRTDVVEVVDSVAPPFERMFVEFQRRSNRLNLDSWGVTFAGTRSDEDEWVMDAALVGEWRKGRPVGPLVRWRFFLDSAGRIRSADAEAWQLMPGVPPHSGPHGNLLMVRPNIPDVPDAEAYNFASIGVDLLAPALFAISLMHCKNVDLRPVEPPERLSHKHQRKTGRPLSRYFVLDIQPMRRVLDGDGEAQTKGLGHALHICRGHFKTFTEDAPLFGKHTGTYWWESLARGKTQHGVVEKDYRIRLDQSLGREYIEADEHPEIRPSASEHTGLDPDLGGRGLRAHNLTQNLLAQAVREAGHEPRRPKPDEPQYDLAWEAGDVIWVAEVKSITPQNEENQLRRALGQVLRYRQLLEAEGRTVKAMIATEVEPSDPSWIELCAREEVALVWAPENLAVQ